MASGTETAIGREAILIRQIGTLQIVNRFIGSIYDSERLLHTIMEVAKEAVDAEACSIALYNATDGLLHIEFASGEKNSELRNMTLEISQGILGQVAASRISVKVDDVTADPRFDNSADLQTGFTTRSIIAVPLSVRDELIGVLEVINKTGPNTQFDDDDVMLLELVASQAALAVNNSRLLEQTILNERLSAIGGMAASIVHDLKNPLMAIRGFSQLLARPDVPEERRSTWGAVVTEEIDRVTLMVQDMLDYAHGKIQLNMQEVPLGEWLYRVSLAFVEEFGLSDMRVVTDFEYRGNVLIDPERLRRVFVNIAGNAMESMEPGGTFHISSRMENEELVLTLKDTGKGIPPDMRAKIFEPFVTRGKSNGTGLGLAIVRQIVDGHNGLIEVNSKVAGESEDGTTGTAFIIRLPLIPSSDDAQDS